MPKNSRVQPPGPGQGGNFTRAGWPCWRGEASADQGMGLALVHSELRDLSTPAAAHDHPNLSAGATEDRDIRAKDPGVHSSGRVE